MARVDPGFSVWFAYAVTLKYTLSGLTDETDVRFPLIVPIVEPPETVNGMTGRGRVTMYTEMEPTMTTTTTARTR